MAVSRLSVGVVIPTLNGAQFLREAIDSVLAQNYADLQCVVVDGGSTDGSKELLQSYGDRIRFVSEPDAGQSDAIQKGFQLLNCDLVGWLNADDRLLPGAIARVVGVAEHCPDAVLYHGDVELIDLYGRLFETSRSIDLDYDSLRQSRGKIVQQGSFYRSQAVRRCGGMCQEFHFVMDLDLWIRLLKVGNSQRIKYRLAQFRVHKAAKSSQPPYSYYRETLRIARRHDADRPFRGMLRRLTNIGVHFLGWKLGLLRNLARELPPPRTHPVVRFEEGAISPEKKAALLLKGEIQEFVEDDSAAAPDIEVCVFGNAKRRLWRKPWNTTLGENAISRILVLPQEPDQETLDTLTKEDPIVSFVVCERELHQTSSSFRFPAFRVGTFGDDQVWEKAIAVATGVSPTQIIT